ncbi:hypothetical protein H2200_006284 [Cladophialophora chaetospira]|uniref:Uncharacterized protein n=1 Tax=Cladophialophora chaetospira TaxID=386627 RepID=A0AA38XAM5_9EURO|nr:hypothetical protein H2200_006284 [Cladophialophora chaetospira]
MPYTASIAVLGRLAGAGIDTLTIAFGQALGSFIPLGIHGEKVLHDAMKRLASCSTFGDVVWFGVGVRHVLRDLVQTSQGAALVALCAALSEGYAPDVSAIVLYEISQSLGAPGELTPSFNQWSALLKVTGSVFKDSSLGERISQLIKLIELAQVILAVGKLLRKQSETIYVHGGPACSWLASWADYILGLRIEVISCAGDTIFVNHATAVTRPQIVIVFSESTNKGTDIECTGTTMVVLSGRQFLKEYFSIPAEDWSERSGDLEWPLRFSGSRLPWDSMLRDTFGDDFVCLMTASAVSSTADNLQLATTPAECGAGADAVVGELGTLFARFIACKSYDIVSSTAVGHVYETYISFVTWSLGRLSELQSLKPFVLTEAHSLLVKEPGKRRNDYIQEQYLQTSQLLSNLCKCARSPACRGYRPTARHRESQDRAFCLVGISNTILYLSYLLSYLILDTPLLPSFCDLLRIYEYSCGSKSSSAINWYGAWGFLEYFGHLSSVLTSIVVTGTMLHSLVPMAVRFHVGAGSIQHGSQMYHEVSGRIRSDVRRCYEVESLEETADATLLSQDTTSPDLSCKAVVEDRAGRLAFWYRITSREGVMTFSPTEQLAQLVKARAYLVEHAHLRLGAGDRKPDFSTLSYAVAKGEGIVPVYRFPHDRFLLRPLRLNTLGRCTALACSANRTALVRSEDELARFLEFWTEAKDQILEGDSILGRYPYYELIP